jgi:acyl-coenzyme A synthetase/AMP-(fatty) acid ligase/thioesterase domain-containing protein/acyl carrier protein
MLRDSEATCVITSRRLREAFPSLFDSSLPWIDIDDVTGQGDDGNPGVAVPPDALTWILYTSGSTGQPKGTVQSHRNILHYVHNYTNGLHISQDDRVLLLYSFGVNAAAHEIYSALLNGAGLYPFNVRADGPARLAGWLLEHEITMYSSVPTVFRHFCEALKNTEDLRHVRVVKLLGEPVAPKDVRSFQRIFSNDCILVNRLGSTETGGIRWNFIDKHTPVDDRLVPVGYALEDNEIVLLDDAGAPVAEGEIGEIVVSSPYLSPGYWRNPEATAKAFGSDPRGAPWRRYRTGDVGRMLADGSLVHHGRRDSQVKILGHRVELGEIEAACAALAGVKEAVVLARRDPAGEPRLVAYLLHTPGAELASVTVRAALRARLPSHMVPSLLVPLDAFPLAQNGKVNRGALPEPDWSRPQVDTTFVPPRTPVEKTVAALWSDVLGVERIGIHDNFFDLGGHSLIALRVLGGIEERFGRRVALPAFLGAPTVGAIATLLADGGVASPWLSLAALHAGGSKPPFFWIHGERSNGLLPRHLGPDQPLYGIVQQSRDGARPRYTRLEEIASFYLEEVRRAQPAGPYFLGGFCVGATLAFEMAQQLRAGGADVALLLLLDPPNPAGHAPNATPVVGSAEHGVARISQPSRLTRSTRSWMRGAFQATADAVKDLACRIHLAAGLETTIPVSLRARYINVVHVRARRRYSPRPYPGKIVVLTTEDRPDPRAGWNPLAGGGLELHHVHARHDEVVYEPSSIEELSKHLGACLGQAQATSSTT